MRSTILSIALIVSVFVFYKLYQIINPFGKKIDQYFHRRGLNENIHRLVVLLILIILVLSVYIWSMAFYKISLINRESINDYIYAFFPQYIIFIFPAIFTGILTSMIAVDFLTRIFFRKYYYEICDNLKIYGGFCTPRTGLLDFTYVFFGLVAIIVLVFFNNCYLIFKNDAIVANSLGSFKEKVYSYSQIEEIYVSTHKRTASGADYENFVVRIVFDDGKKIATSDLGYRFLRRDIQHFIDFVSEKSNKEPIVKKYVKDFKSIK